MTMKRVRKIDQQESATDRENLMARGRQQNGRKEDEGRQRRRTKGKND